jgi:hypothetical protein
VKTPPTWEQAAPDTAQDGSQTQRAAKPSPDAKIRREADSTQAKNCTTCGVEFVPRRRHYRKCKPCAEHFKQELVEHGRKRNADGVTVFKLLEHLRQLRSDDPEASAWLQSLIEHKGDV